MMKRGNSSSAWIKANAASSGVYNGSNANFTSPSQPLLSAARRTNSNVVLPLLTSNGNGSEGHDYNSGASQGLIKRSQQSLHRGEALGSARHGFRSSQLSGPFVTAAQGPTVGSTFFNNTRTAKGSELGTTNNDIARKSVYDRLKGFGAIKGPISILLTIHYVYFLIIFAIAKILNFGPNIREYFIFIYFLAFYVTLQLTRIVNAFRPDSMFSLYVSLIPFALLLFFSREIHMMIAVLFYVTGVIIHLQSGHQRLQMHLFLYSVIFIVEYGVVLALMSWFFTDTSKISENRGDALQPGINWMYEIVFGLCLMMTATWYILLEKFVKTYALTLIERETYMNNLFATNIELRRELRRAKRGQELKEINLDAPIATVNGILTDIQGREETSASVKESLDFVLHVLASNKLFAPDLNENKVDDEVHDWLNSMLQTKAQPDYRQDSKELSLKTQSSSNSVLDSMQRPPQLREEDEEDDNAADAGAHPTHRDHTGAGPTHHPRNINRAVEKQIWRYLETIESWSFNPFELSRLSDGHPLHYVTLASFRKWGFMDIFPIPDAKFKAWLRLIESGYRETNSYHNANHAADVTHAMHFFLTRNRHLDAFTPEERLGAILASVIHDYQHPGVNNAFLISTRDPLAIRYNDRAILEHYHSATAFELLAQEEYSVFENFSRESRRAIRDVMTSCVLATDMTEHFEFVGKFKNKLTGVGFNMDDVMDRRLILNVAIKSADISNPTKPRELCKKWTELIIEEFFQQGDTEKKRGLPVSSFMSRETTDVPKSQVVRIFLRLNGGFFLWFAKQRETTDFNLFILHMESCFNLQ
jgi:hypothetical protein